MVAILCMPYTNVMKYVVPHEWNFLSPLYICTLEIYFTYKIIWWLCEADQHTSGASILEVQILHTICVYCEADFQVHSSCQYRYSVNTLRPTQNGRRFADDTFKCIFLNENVRILIKISLKFVPKGPVNNNPALFQIMAWRRSGDKPLSEPMMVSLLTHICITWPQWVNSSLVW